MNFPMINRDIPAVVRAAQLIGVTGAGVLTGANIMFSVVLIPTLMDAPGPVAAKQWKKAYDLGKFIIPPGTIITGGVFGYLAWRERHSSTSSLSLYTAAALLAPTMIPYTFAFMKSTNEQLEEKASSLASSTVGETKDESVNALLDRWGTLNLVRGALIATSAILGAWASLQPMEVLGLDRIEVLTNANRMG